MIEEEKTDIIWSIHSIGEAFFMAILVTGGAGYIGSHTCVELLNGRSVIIIII